MSRLWDIWVILSERSSYEVIADTVRFLGSNGNGNGGGNGAATADHEDEEIPF